MITKQDKETFIQKIKEEFPKLTWEVSEDKYSNSTTLTTDFLYFDWIEISIYVYTHHFESSLLSIHKENYTIRYSSRVASDAEGEGISTSDNLEELIKETKEKLNRKLQEALECVS
jgi:hypothetical protein